MFTINNKYILQIPHSLHALSVGKGCLEYIYVIYKLLTGSCRTYNIIYLVRCSACDKAYIGHTVKQLHERKHGHRAKFHDIINGNIIDINSDEYCLDVHLLEHGLTEHDDFNKRFKICIIENCSPKLLEYKENKYIHLLKTLKPWALILLTLLELTCSTDFN